MSPTSSKGKRAYALAELSALGGEQFLENK